MDLALGFLVAVFALTVTFVSVAICWWCWLAPRMRRNRIESFNLDRRLRAKIRFDRPLLPAQQHIEDQLEELRNAKRMGTAAWKRARMWPLPIPPAMVWDQTPSSQLERLAKLFDHPGIALAVAGGEQFVRNVIDMALPGAVQNLTEHAIRGLIDGAHHAVTIEGITAIGKEILQSAAEGGGLHVGQAVSVIIQHVATEAGQSAVQTALQHVPENFDLSAAQGFHFPYVTLIFSTARELTLLADGKTTLDVAIKHVVVTTAATSFGAFAGAKAGALAGSLLGPAGAAAGALGGAIVGAICGKAIGTEINRGPLDAAIEEYRSISDRSNAQIEASAQQVIVVTQTQALAEQSNYHNSLGATPPPLKAKVSPLRAIATRLRDKSRASHDAMLEELPEAVAALRRSLPHSSWLGRVFGIAVRHEAEDQLRAIETKVRKELKKRCAALPTDTTILDEPLQALEAIASLPLLRANENDGVAEEAVEEVRKVVVALWRQIGERMVGSAARFRAALITIQDILEAEALRHAEEVRRQRMAVEEAMDKVRREKEALGL